MNLPGTQATEKRPNKQKRSGIMGLLWPTIEDLETAVEAAKNAQMAAYWMALSYVVQVAFLFLTGRTIFSGLTAGDNVELYLLAGLNAGVACGFLWLGLRIRSGKLGSVPFIAVWCLIEVGAKTLLLAPGRGLAVSVIFLAVALGALRGWFSVRKFQAAAGRSHSGREVN